MASEHDKRIQALEAEVDRLSKVMDEADGLYRTARMCWQLEGKSDGEEFNTLVNAYTRWVMADSQLASAQDLLHAARMARQKNKS